MLAAKTDVTDVMGVTEKMENKDQLENLAKTVLMEDMG